MIRAKIVGAGGYGGVGITELLTQHPEAEVGCLVDIADNGKKLSDLYPHLQGHCDLEVVSPEHETANEDYDVVFFSTPDQVGMKLAKAELDRGAKVIDYSGDFRFNTADAYAEYATRIGLNPAHAAPELLPDSSYGVAELHRNEINTSRKVIGNAGCFAITSILGLTPAMKHGLVCLKSIICDCKTGVSGAGKTPHPLFHYPSRYEQMNAYKLGGHQHVCEVERELSLQAEEDVKVTFTTQVVPICRGIMGCLYGTLKEGVTWKDVWEAYKTFEQENHFIRVTDKSTLVGTVEVRTTNYCHLTVDVDERTNRLRVISHIDNLVKGQAGNALQNMNLLFGLPEDMGLNRIANYP